MVWVMVQGPAGWFVSCLSPLGAFSSDVDGHSENKSPVQRLVGSSDCFCVSFIKAGGDDDEESFGICLLVG